MEPGMAKNEVNGVNYCRVGMGFVCQVGFALQLANIFIPFLIFVEERVMKRKC